MKMAFFEFYPVITLEYWYLYAKTSVLTGIWEEWVKYNFCIHKVDHFTSDYCNFHASKSFLMHLMIECKYTVNTQFYSINRCKKQGQEV